MPRRSHVQRVLEAHQVLESVIGETPGLRGIELRRSLIAEEALEVEHALESGDLANVGGELADLIYVLAGALVTFGMFRMPEPEARAIPRQVPRLRWAALCAGAIRATTADATAAIRAGHLEAAATGIARAARAAEAVGAMQGLDVEPFFAAVHAANLAKAGGTRRPDGKWNKPEGWQPADLAGILETQRRERTR